MKALNFAGTTLSLVLVSVITVVAVTVEASAQVRIATFSLLDRGACVLHLDGKSTNIRVQEELCDQGAFGPHECTAKIKLSYERLSAYGEPNGRYSVTHTLIGRSASSKLTAINTLVKNCITEFRKINTDGSLDSRCNELSSQEIVCTKI